MSSTSPLDWKEKYLTALEEFESSQIKDQGRLDILRKGLVRVSLAADGLDETLDEQLSEIRSALRSNRDIQTLEPLIAQLERTVVALEDRRKDEHGEIRTLVDQQLEKYLELGLPRKSKSQIKSLRKSLPQLLSGNGMNPEVWKSLNHTQDQVSEHFQKQIIELSEGKEGFLSRLFSPGANNNEEDDIEPIDQDEGDLDVAPKDLSEETPQPDTEQITNEQNNVETKRDEKDLVDRLGHTLSQLLSHLDVPANYNVRKENLVSLIESPFQLNQVPEFLEETAQLVASTRLVAQKEFEGFLVALHQRLNDIQDFLVTAREGEDVAHQNQKRLDDDVRQELHDMRNNLETNTDIGQIKNDIEGMVERIVATVDAFHHDEEQRREEVYQRIETLAQRMESMETEASELKSSLEAQRMEALRDALTELPNRAAYDDQIEAEFSRWRRHNRPLSMSIVDIDHFKTVNDTLGHLRGDKVLKLVAREVSRKVRAEDFVARYGGEEFIVIMPDTDLTSAMAAMEKVRAAVEECPFNFNQQRIPITASFGVTSFQEGDSIEACFERADKALYKAKDSGRNQVIQG